jgi:hypothetical protein
MGDWTTQYSGGPIETLGTISSSHGPTVTGSATLNTKGAYTQLTAATAREAQGFYLHIGSDFNVGDCLFDVAVGAAGSEQVIVSNIKFSRPNDTYSAWYYFPVRIPAGSRVACRIQATSASIQVWPNIYLLPSSPMWPAGFGRCTTYGANTATSGGTSVDGGGTINTKGAYSQIVAATTSPMRAFAVGIGPANDFARVVAAFSFDIAIGAAASEQIILADMTVFQAQSADHIPVMQIGPFPCDIPTGTRLAARCSASTITAGDRANDIIIYGMD